MKIETTYTANVYVGLKEGYTGNIMSFEDAESFIETYMDNKPMCVSVTRTHFYYKNGNEPGLIIGFINYPRFPNTNQEIQEYVLDFSMSLLQFCSQMRVSIVFPDRTIMLSNQEAIERYTGNRNEDL